MLKFGIWDPAALTPASLSGPFGRRKFLAATLYPAVAASAHPERDRLLEQILVRFPTRNATLKRTQSQRFEAFDRAVIETIRKHFRGAKEPLAIHDVGVSDGRTAVDFFRRLDSALGAFFRMVASDYAPDVCAIEAGGPLVVVIDSATEDLLQVIRPPFVFNVPQGESPWLYPVNRLLLRWLLRTAVPELVRRWREGDACVRVQPIRLLHPHCRDLAENDARFGFERYDLLTPPFGRFDVVRVMNLLNPAYFTKEQLGIAIDHVFGSLREGGLFVTGSNEDAASPVQGAVYERTRSGFERRFVSGDGSFIDPIAVRYEAAA